MSLVDLVYWGVWLCFGYLFVVYAAFALLLAASAAEHAFRVRQERIEDYEAIEASRLTIPVSVIAPAYNESAVIVSAVTSLLEQEYPEYEVIVVNDGSSDETLARLEEAFGLEPREMFYRRIGSTRRVRAVYASRSHPRLLVVDKENGGKADALNCGLNLARYRYVCTVDGDTVYFPDALLKGMRLALVDPARIVGVTAKVAVTSRPEEGDRTGAVQRIDRSALTNFQFLDYLRAFLNNRLGWTRWNFMLCSVGAFAIWRRDVVAELGGFSGAFTCEDIEFTFRVHEAFRQARRPCRIVALPDTVGRAEGPDTVARLVSQRARWQRVITETVWAYRRMFLNPRYGSVGLLGMPFYVVVEVLAPLFQVLAVALVPLAAALGLLALREFLLLLLTVAFVNGALSNVAVLLHDATARSHPLRDLVRLMLLGPLDLFWYRPILFYAQAKGAVDFLRGEKRWNKFERNRRHGPAPV